MYSLVAGRLLLALALGSIATFAVACDSSSSSPGSPPSKPSASGDVKLTSHSVPEGTAVGEEVSATIDAKGGSVKSADGRFMLTIPAGALVKATEIGVRGVTDTAPGGIGAAYLLTPSGTKFATAATAQFKYAVGELDGAPETSLAVAYQSEDGFWNGVAVKNTTADAKAKTVSAATLHLSTWALRTSLPAFTPADTTMIASRDAAILNSVNTAPSVGQCDLIAKVTLVAQVTAAYDQLQQSVNEAYHKLIAETTQRLQQDRDALTAAQADIDALNEVKEHPIDTVDPQIDDWIEQLKARIKLLNKEVPVLESQIDSLNADMQKALHDLDQEKAKAIAQAEATSCDAGTGVPPGDDGDGGAPDASVGPTDAGGGSESGSIGPIGLTPGGSHIAASDGDYTCVIQHGAVKCWGVNDSGQLGDGTTTNSLRPVTVGGVTDAVALAAGGNFTCALRSTGTVACWGLGKNGALGRGNTESSPTAGDVPGLTGVVRVVAGTEHACALLATGTVKCWGGNEHAQLGPGANSDSSSPIDVPGLSGVSGLSAGSYDTCVILGGGTVKCWGSNFAGELGDAGAPLGDSGFVGTPHPVDIPGLTGVTAITNGSGYACALLSGGGVSCWGNGVGGLLGNGGATSSRTPVSVTGLSGVTTIAAGIVHTCAIVAGGAVRCWGASFVPGMLGQGSGAPSPTPVAVADLTGAVAISAGFKHTCALLENGSVACWGVGAALGNGTTTPVPVHDLTGVAAISAGNAHTCAVLADGGVSCWGNDVAGQLGDGTKTSSFAPLHVAGLPKTAAVSLGSDSTCALLSTGGVQCWGANGLGQLGTGNTTPSLQPVPVPGLAGVTSLGSSSGHACAIVPGTGVECWGDNTYAELGHGTGANSLSPAPATGLSDATNVVTGSNHGCAIVSGGAVKCWGSNDRGQIGDNQAEAYALTPLAVPGLSGVTALTAGRLHTCALLGDGSVKCWGDVGVTSFGGTISPQSSTPLAIAGLSRVKAIGSFADHTCALLDAGTVKCWGDNYNGNLGNWSIDLNSPTPVDVYGLTGVTAIAVGGAHTCALLAGGTVSCWGSNSAGQLANGAATPVLVMGL